MRNLRWMTMAAVLCLATQSLWAQQQPQQYVQAASAAVQELAQAYQLDSDQKAKLLKVQTNHFRNLAEIEPIRHTDEDLYIVKFRTLRDHSDQSLRLILREDQRPIFDERMAERRRVDSDRIKELKTQGADRPTIQKAILGIE